ncbi:Rha family transcriptional regulator [Parasutterella excrementihominis]|uniref:Rha family transcriptional regulator n=1 Tax=Parasutterella excrementihominis TaxID=487175 RepID=UPI003AB7A475
MTTRNPCALAPIVSIVNNTVTALSTDVAQFFGKEHKNVLRDIENLLNILPESRRLNFELCFENSKLQNGKPLKRYRMTRDGFTLLVMGWTGEKALQFKLAWLDAFNDMERKLYQYPVPREDKTLSPAEQFSIRNAVGKKAKKSPSTYRFIYSLLKQRFQVARYSQISTYDFREALNFIKELKLPAPYSEPLPAPARTPAEYDDEDQTYKLTISRRELERFGTFIYNWRYQFHDALVLYVNHLVAVKSPYSRKLYDATFDSSLQRLEELFREHGISIGPDLPNPERLRTLAYSI